MKILLSDRGTKSANTNVSRRAAQHTFPTIQAALVVLDFVLVYLAFQAAYNLRFITLVHFFRESIIPQVSIYRSFMQLAIPLWILIFAALGLYNERNILGGTREYSLLLNATSIGMFLIIAAGFLMPNELILARGWVILAWLLAFIFAGIGRFCFRRFVYSMRRRGKFQVPGLIIGTQNEGQLLAEQFVNHSSSSMRLVGYVNTQPNPALNGSLTWLGRLEELDEIVEKYGVKELILPISELTQDEIMLLFRKYGTSKDINLRMSSGLYEIITTGVQVSEEGLVPLLTINKVRMTGIDQALKLLMDYAIAIPVVILLLPIFAIVAIAIRLESHGPIIHRRRVMGVNGRQFDAFKFRSMCIDCNDLVEKNPELQKEYEANFKLKDDPRVTRVGKFIRKTSIDELPQLFNVLRNEMSVVGPRMITPMELNKYQQWDINLLTVKPGITGMWQVRGRSDVGYEERVKLDMFYIRNWTAWLDLQLLVQTIPAVLSKRGAY